MKNKATMSQSFEQWEQRLREKILSRFDESLTFDEKFELMTPDEKLRFMSAHEIHALNIKTVNNFAKHNKSLTIDEHIEKKAVEFVERVTKNKTKKALSKKQIEKNKAYFEKVKTEPKKKGFIAPKKRINLMSYEKARVIFYKDYLRNSFKDKRKSFVVDEHNQEVIKKLLMYFIGDIRCESKDEFENPISLTKSIFLFGPIHTGKTNLMTQLSKFTQDYHLETAFEMSSFSETMTHCESDGLKYLFRFKNKSYCHDELVVKNIKSFGNIINPAQSLVAMQYDSYNNRGVYTHYTSNATPDELIYGNVYEEIKPLFDFRTRTRFQNMYNMIYLSGDSRI